MSHTENNPPRIEPVNTAVRSSTTGAAPDQPTPDRVPSPLPIRCVNIMVIYEKEGHEPGEEPTTTRSAASELQYHDTRIMRTPTFSDLYSMSRVQV